MSHKYRKLIDLVGGIAAFGQGHSPFKEVLSAAMRLSGGTKTKQRTFVAMEKATVQLRKIDAALYGKYAS
jgi:hypothetical protein